MKIFLSKQDCEIMFSNLYTDGSGTIELKEFLKKLRRFGVKMRGTEEDLVYQIYDAIKKANLTLKQAFEIFDRNKDNLISRNDMKDTFDAMNFGVSAQNVNEFFNLADIDGDGTISCDEFTRLFEKVIKEIFM